MQSSTLSLLAASLTAAVLLSSCEPTPRTAISKKKADEPSAPAATDAAATPAPAPAKPAVVAPVAKPATPIDSLVDITATHQEYDIVRPWQKKATSQSSARGLYLGDGRILTIGSIGRAATYIEVSLPNSSQKATASIIKHDPDRNLTLIELKDKEQAKEFFETRHALSLGEALGLGSEATLWKTVRGNQAQKIDIKVERGSEGSYSSPRLVASSGQAISGSEATGLPVIKDGKLVALSVGYNDKLQTLDLVNAEVIDTFLKQEDKEKLGAPILGVSRSFVKDPVLLRYLKVDEKTPGYYISEVHHGGAAQQSGLKVGDLILEIDGKKIDSRGQSEHPLYGSLDAFAFAQGVHQVGDEVAMKVARDGKILDLTIKLNRDYLTKHLFSDVQAGDAPRYILHGGFLFQPLSAGYMSSVRNMMRGGLPAEYLELEKRSEELIKRGYTELVGLTMVLPTPATLGYNNVGFCFVEKVNGKEVHNLAELEKAIDEPTPNGVISITTNKPPYHIFLDRKLAEESNDRLRRIDIPALRKVK